MPVPKRKRSRARRDSRFANKGVKVKSFSKCPTENCSAPALPHQACKECGRYKGVKVLRTKNERVVKRVETRTPQEQTESNQ
jgi:large subunit ribosomal protein L32